MDKSVPFPGKSPASKFIVPAQDRHGHSAGIHCRVPPGMIRDVNNLMMHMAEFGWENHSDFYRWCIRQGIEAAAKEIGSKTLSNLGAERKAMEELLTEELMHARFNSDIDKAEKVIQALDEGGDRERVIKLLLNMQKHIGNIDEPYWRGKWQKEFERRFGRYLIKASLTDFDE